MTATFGKLENKTLRLEPGFNVIHAPNEWGKSTWCAFLVAMLYGIDTRERSKSGCLADKERYAPWSGSPVSGRMDICWNGRDITIQRSTKGRSIMGQFHAYETRTGLPVTELTAENCGQQLLGVEKSVFSRAGFIKFSDLPVSEDEALRRRLNALVTTGDESGDSDDLAQKLKNLKNRCRHNRTGLLPAAEAQRDNLKASLNRLQQLRQEQQALTQTQQQLSETLITLQNHQTALEFESAGADSRRVEEALRAQDAAKARYEALLTAAGDLPDAETVENHLLHLEQLQLQQESLSDQPLPPVPVAPEAPAAFAGLTPNQALQQAQDDKSRYVNLAKRSSPLLWILATGCVVGAIALFFLVSPWAALAPMVLALCLAAFRLYTGRQQKNQTAAIAARYGNHDPESWVALAEGFQQATQTYEKEYTHYTKLCQQYNDDKAALLDNVENCTGGLSIREAIRYWQQAQQHHRQLEQAQESLYQAQQHTRTLSEMAKSAPAPAFEDKLTLTADETMRQISDIHARQQQLQQLSAQLTGKMDALGQEESLSRLLETTENRIRQLEAIYEATTLGMEFLEKAAANLQRKFAPAISQRAGEFFRHLTGGRYDRLVLSEDLSLEVAAEEETVTRNRLWRSDGTTDQLYLALRLAVAGELTPHGPLVLDDALVRFDDDRLGRAMEILKRIAADKQVIVFTCQSRESKYL